MARPRDDNKLRQEFVMLTPKQRQWLELWRPGKSTDIQLRDVIDRAEKMFPLGPFRFGHVAKKPRKKVLPRSLKAYAAERGVTVEEIIIEMWRERINK